MSKAVEKTDSVYRLTMDIFFEEEELEAIKNEPTAVNMLIGGEWRDLDFVPEDDLVEKEEK